MMLALTAQAPLVAAITGQNWLSVVLASGLVIVFIALSVLIWTRLGQARPIAKCVVLSLLAHVLLLIYACSTKVLYGPPGKWYGQEITIRLTDAADDAEAAPHPAANAKPWEQSGESGLPLIERQPGETSDLASQSPTAAAPPVPIESSEPAPRNDVATAVQPPQAPSQPPESVPAKVADSPPEMPPLADLLPEDFDNPKPSAPASVAAQMPDNPLRTQPAELAPETGAMAPQASLPPMPNGAAQPEQFVTKMTERPAPRRLGDGQDVPEPLRARLAADRLKAAIPFGATPQTEAAVAAALDWLARVQSADGRWDADAHGAGRETRTLGHDRHGAGAQADTGVSGLALLAFLGAGHTHLEGKHRHHVQIGLEYLLASQAADGNLAGRAEMFAAMYCHGIATLALSEAYALTGDERLLPGLKQALQYTLDAQHPSGGWRYRPYREQPYDPGDMSQLGWQLMALKSAELGGIPMPTSARLRMVRFMDSCSSGRSRGLASYRPGDRATRTMTAEALACRYFLSADAETQRQDEAARFVCDELPGTGTPNLYYWYYGTLGLFQRQGEEWSRWNKALIAELLNRQRWDGNAAGSWEADDAWGGYGGRIYSTAMSALCLEVYYRYLPIYGHALDESRFTERSGLPPLPR